MENRKRKRKVRKNRCGFQEMKEKTKKKNRKKINEKEKKKI